MQALCTQCNHAQCVYCIHKRARATPRPFKLPVRSLPVPSSLLLSSICQYLSVMYWHTQRRAPIVQKCVVYMYWTQNNPCQIPVRVSFFYTRFNAVSCSQAYECQRASNFGIPSQCRAAKLVMLSVMMMMIAFINLTNILVSLIEGLCSSNPCESEFSGFRRNRTDDLGIKSPSL